MGYDGIAMKFSQEQLDQLEELFDRKFDEKLAVFKTEFKSELIVAVGEMIEEQILPQFSETKETVDHHQRILIATKKSLATA